MASEREKTDSSSKQTTTIDDSELTARDEPLGATARSRADEPSDDEASPPQLDAQPPALPVLPDSNSRADTSERSLWTQISSFVEQSFVDAMAPELWERIRSMPAGDNAHGYDPFGFQPEFLKYVVPICQWIYDTYFRVDIRGIEHIPDDGPVLLVSNHTGQIPIDGLLIATACLVDKRPPRMTRSMVERWVPSLPFISVFLSRCGQVMGSRENCRILLDRDNCILVFPEGAEGITKTYDHAYELDEFGLGFMRLALENDTPIVPIGVVGGEEQIPSIWNFESLGKLMGMPGFPVSPTWPALGPAGGIPLPVKYQIRFGEPMKFQGAADDEDRHIQARVDEVRKVMRQLIDDALRERKRIFF
jgi:1-acyl-sn-glycerol-3-phosphate acyltransferase